MVSAYLNGTKLKRVITLKTLVSKTVGIMFSCGANLFVGKEGPCIHAGAIVAAVLSQARPETLKRFKCVDWKRFRNDRDKRSPDNLQCVRFRMLVQRFCVDRMCVWSRRRFRSTIWWSALCDRRGCFVLASGVDLVDVCCIHCMSYAELPLAGPLPPLFAASQSTLPRHGAMTSRHWQNPR